MTIVSIIGAGGMAGAIGGRVAREFSIKNNANKKEKTDE
jgi:ABC-type methionine transport system permease subunit